MSDLKGPPDSTDAGRSDAGLSDAQLWRFVDGELARADAAAIERAAAADGDIAARIAARIADMRAMSAGVFAGAPKPPAGFPAKVAAAARLRGTPPPAELLEMQQFVRRVLIAATIVGAVGLAYMAFDVVPDLVDRLVAEPDPFLERP